MDADRDDDDIADLEGELASLRSQLFATRLGGIAGLVAVAGIALAPRILPATPSSTQVAVPEVVRARAFEVIGPDGKPWATLDVDRNPPGTPGGERYFGPSLKLMFEGKERARLGLNGVGSGVLEFLDPQGREKLSIGSAPEDTGLAIYDGQGHMRLEAGCKGGDFGALITFLDGKERNRMTLGVNSQEEPIIEAREGSAVDMRSVIDRPR